MASVLELERMSRTEKLRVMEAIWADLSQEEDQVESPAWHAKALQETAARVGAGLERALDWEAAKRDLRASCE
jgi:hypothetical protein